MPTELKISLGKKDKDTVEKSFGLVIESLKQITCF